jgi:hypothetical protein
MAVNKEPRYPASPLAGWGTLTTANTAKDGTGTVVTVFTAGADGALAPNIRVEPMGTNVQTVARVFLNNGSTNATPANNALLRQHTIPASTLSETSAPAPSVISLGGVWVPAGHKLNVVIGTAVAAGLAVSVLGGSFTA